MRRIGAASLVAAIAGVTLPVEAATGPEQAARQGGIHASIGVAGIMQPIGDSLSPVPFGGNTQFPCGPGCATTTPFGFDSEGRLGYSLDPRLQIFVSANYGTTWNQVGDPAQSSVRAFDSLLCFNGQAAFLAERTFFLYGRGGLGLGMMGGATTAPGSFVNTTMGLAGVIGIGSAIHMSPGWSMGPEIFYRLVQQRLPRGASSTFANIVGVQINLAHY